MYKSDFELTNTEVFDAINDGYDFYREENPRIHAEESKRFEDKSDAYINSIESITSEEKRTKYELPF